MPQRFGGETGAVLALERGEIAEVGERGDEEEPGPGPGGEIDHGIQAGSRNEQAPAA